MFSRLSFLWFLFFYSHPLLSAELLPSFPPDHITLAHKPFFTEGPIRFPIAQWEGKKYIGSDDGWLVCVDEKTGAILWKVQGGPTDKKILSAGRVVSAWQVSGGPVVHEGKVYAAFGAWPCMGVFIYCYDAQSGRTLWCNDSATHMWKAENVSEQVSNRPDFEPSFISVAPNGPLFIKGDRLGVPCGRANPAYFDLKTGKFLEFHYGGKAPHVLGEGSPVAPDFNRMAEQTQNCFPADPLADDILQQTNIHAGYCLVLGLGNGRLVEGLISHSKLFVVAIDPNPQRVAELREKWHTAGVYGTRVSVHLANWQQFGLPQHFANLTVAVEENWAGDDSTAQSLKKLFPAIRPYGGKLFVKTTKQELPSLQQAATDLAATWQPGDGFGIMERAGPLPGADDWSHEFASAANTRASRDERVKPPFGVLWYGGPSSEVHRYYENHRGYGVPKVAGGRLIVEGPKLLTVCDVYTGRLLWEWKPGPEDQEAWSYEAKNVHRAFEPLAGRVTATADVIYVLSDRRLHALNADTGQPFEGFQFAERDEWGSPKVHGDRLYLSTSSRVLALDRHSGKVLWTYGEQGGTLAVGQDKVFCIEYPWPDRFENNMIGPNGRWTNFIENWQAIKRRGGTPDVKEPRLVALNAESGKPLWTQKIPPGQDFVRRLIYAEKHDLLLLPGNGRIYQASAGEQAGKTNLMERTLVCDDLVWGYGNLSTVVNLSTRKVNERLNPITLLPQVWRTDKTGNGCGPAVGAPHLLSFRSGSAAYCSLGDATTGCGEVANLGGFRSSCQPSLIPANGLLASPNAASGGCTCRYPFATSLALIHDPDMEHWGSYGPLPVSAPVRRLGLNFGAPGDRTADDGTLWLDYPSIGGPSPEITLTTDPAQPQWFRHHASRVTAGTAPRWVAASGSQDLRSLTLTLHNPTPRTYRVRIYYVEPLAPSLHLRSTVEEHRHVAATQTLTWKFEPGRWVSGLELVDEELIAK